MKAIAMAHEHDHHESHGATYLAVFFALCVFTALSVVADMVHMADKNVLRVVVLAIATAKALCVMLYFMHLKFERAWKYLLLAPTFILALALPFALAPDVGLEYYTRDVPQVKEYAQLVAAGHGGDHGHGEAGHEPHADPRHGAEHPAGHAPEAHPAEPAAHDGAAKP